MSSLILGFILSIPAGIIANLLTKYFDNSLNVRNLEVETIDLHSQTKNTTENINREENRKKLKESTDILIFFSISFLLMTVSFYYPLIINDGILNNNDLDFKTTKLGIDFILTKNNFIYASFIFSFIVYIPLWILSGIIINSITNNILINYIEITKVKYTAMRVIVMMFFAIFFAANIYYIINPTITWIDSIKYTFIFILLPLFYGISNP